RTGPIVKARVNDPAVVPRLVPRDGRLLLDDHQPCTRPSLQELPGRREPDDAAADDDHVPFHATIICFLEYVVRPPRSSESAAPHRRAARAPPTARRLPPQPLATLSRGATYLLTWGSSQSSAD